MPPTPTLLQKLFNKKSGLVSPCKEFKEEAVFSWPLPEFNPSQIRLIVYQDCERRGRNVLFDSNAKRRTEDVSISVHASTVFRLKISRAYSLSPS